MKLIFTSDEFKVGNYSYNGFPILLHENMTTFREGLDFLLYHCIQRGRVASKNSWITYGRDFYDFFAFIDANNLDWRAVNTRGDGHIIAVYRDASLTKFNLAESTVNRRLRLIIKFYQYAAHQGWVSELPYSVETITVRQPKSFLAHTDRSGGNRSTADVLLKTRKTTIKVLSSSQVEMLLMAIKDSRFKLMIRLGLATGLRKEELLTFPKSYVIDPRRYPVNGFYIVTISPKEMSTKGSHERSIHVPKSLMEDLWQYIIHERPILSALREDQYNELFLNENGKPYSTKSNTLNARLNKLGLPFDIFPHILRHTYATHTLYALQRQPNLSFNPLMYVRDRLGHSSITTTERYLHFIDDIADIVLNEYQREIDTMLIAV